MEERCCPILKVNMLSIGLTVRKDPRLPLAKFAFTTLMMSALAHAVEVLRRCVNLCEPGVRKRDIQLCRNMTGLKMI